MKLGKAINHKITIEPSHNMGFIVKIGCGKFVADTPGQLLTNLTEYFGNPEKWEKEYLKIGGCTEEDREEIRREPRPERVPPPQPIAPETERAI